MEYPLLVLVIAVWCIKSEPKHTNIQYIKQIKGVDNRKSLLIDKGPFDEVQKECRNLGGFLILAESEENHWIPIQKVLHSEWRWTDGRIYGNHIVHPGTEVEGQECAVMRTRDCILDEVSCFKPTFGYICQTNNSQSCLKSDSGRILLNGKLLVVYHDKVRWFKAVHLCQQNNMELVTFLNKKTLQKLFNELYSRWNVDGHFWIGLTKSYWTLQIRNHRSDNKVVLNNWLDTDEMPLGNCAVSKHTSHWKVADCNEQHPALCQIKHNDDTTTSYGTVTTPQALTVTETPRVLQHTTETGSVPGVTIASNLVLNSTWTQITKINIIMLCLLIVCTALTTSTLICYILFIKKIHKFSDNKTGQKRKDDDVKNNEESKKPLMV